ncbi:S-layer family protein [Pseudorhodoferax sp. Leaf274]|uniref:beta strand repeat-containing protein n=1 Tax=Pseudorhodoferax sp. Leaf274 TaxID=1736318 RepID=UPI000702DECB|nr:putative Ig domain-containing protein [Pseudorhodoferax sp. Leaf274]KQP43919.1 hypothetical protein ASF44_28745 [Pseudorhodoferax sp. Leaf274]
MAFPQGFRLKAGYYWRLGDRSGPYVVDKDGNARLVGGSGTIVPPPMVLEGWPKPAANVGEPYVFYPVVVSGTGAKTFSVVSGSLPAGLAINASTGVISGILTTAGSSTFSVRAVDANGEAATIGPFTVRVAATGSVLAIYGDPVLNAAVGVPYSLQLGASGGVQPYTFAVASGSLPAGVSINANTGLVSGSPTSTGTSANIVLRVTDAANETVSLAPFTIVVAAAPATLTISGTPATSATVGTAYSFTPVASGGVTPRTFSLVAGTLPAGLSFNTGTGAITGTPTSAGTASGLSIRVTDNVGATATLASFNLAVSAGVVAPGAPTGVTATAGDGYVDLAWLAPSSNGGSAITGYRLVWSGGQQATVGNVLSGRITGVTNGQAGTAVAYAINSAGESVASAASNSVTPSASYVEPTPLVARAGAAQGQWAKPLYRTNTIDRSTAGDYTMMGSAGQGGQFYVTKLVNGVPQSTVVLDTNEIDDHNEPSFVQLWNGAWMAIWNRHGITGQYGFRYAVTATPHGMDFGAVQYVAGGGTTADYQSTYNQVFMHGQRLIVTYRIGTSSGGWNVLRYSDNGGRTWSAERQLHGLTYQTSAKVGNELRSLAYLHPLNGSQHNIFEFVINLDTGDITAGGASLGNAYSAGATIPSANMRKAISVVSGTSRMYEFDGETVSYQVMPDIQSSGTYRLGKRIGTTGEYVSVDLGATGLPSLSSVTGYYGSCLKLDATHAAISVNLGPNVGVGSWALRILRTDDNGASYQVIETIRTTANIIMRINCHEGRIYWTEFTSYPYFDNFQGFISSVPYPALQWTKEPSVAASTVPGKPDAPTATAGDGTVSTAFTAPSTGGAPILEYGVQLSNNNANTGTPTASPIAVASANGSAVTSRVRARNISGWGPYSDPSNSVTPTAAVTAPGAPTIGTATAGDGSASVAGTAPASNGGAAITKYRAIPYVGSTAGTPVESATLPVAVTGLTNGTAYTFKLQAFNSVGWGAESAASNAVTPAAATGTTWVAASEIALVNMTKLSAGKFQSTSSAGSWAGAIQTLQTLDNGQVGGGRVQYLGDGTESAAVSAGASKTDPAFYASARAFKITATGGISTVTDAGGDVSTGYTMTAGHWARLWRKSDNIWYVQRSADGETGWTDIAAIGAALPGQYYIRFHSTYSTGVTPNQRQVNNPSTYNLTQQAA